jgi:hypothetical protein
MQIQTARLRLAFVLSIAALSACATARVHDPLMSADAPYRIHPSVAWVEDFEIPAAVQDDPDRAEQAREVMEVVTRTTVDTLNGLGYSARRAPPPETREGDLPPLGAVLVRGHFEEIEDGNVFGRVLIGFGLGASRLRSDVGLDWLRDGETRPLFQCEVRADGSKMPGLIVPIGLASEIGLLINGLMKGVGELKGPLAGDARRTGEAIGRRLAVVFHALEWEGS